MASSNYYFLVLDIETSKEMKFDEKLNKEMPYKVWLSYGVCKFFDINGYCHSKCMFRKWEELAKYLATTTATFKENVFCYVHNLSFEFDYLIKNIARPKKFLCNSSHSVISAVLENYRIEFRCTYQLSKLPLFKIGEMFGYPKLESDYRNIYPDEEVTQEEWDYCERDCDIIVPYILDLLKTYKMLCRIPYTSTGKVRTKLKSYNGLSEIENWDLMPPENCYTALSKSFRGAITMSNPRFTNVKINGLVRSFDEKSKYPSVMLCKEYPYTIEKMDNFTQDTYKEYKFWIAKVKLIDVYSKYDWGVISHSTCEKVDLFGADIFNGKIINIKECVLYLTNIDLDMFLKVYNIKEVIFEEFYPCKNYARLPSQFIELIKDYAEPKARIGKELKIIEKEYGEDSTIYKEKYKEYMDSKALLNGIYGMMVQKLVQSEYKIDDNFVWYEVDKEYKQIPNKHLNRNFLYGLYITAYSRYDLVINIIHNCPENFVYCDTDSIKFIDIGKEFEDLNDDLPEDLQQFYYLKGFNKFEEEEPYTEFITYGAKKYAYVRNGVFGFTVAGLPKKTTINSFDEFKLGTTYTNCKLAKRYIYHQSYTDVDEFTQQIINKFVEENGELYDNGGIALFETDYSLNMTSLDLEYIKEYKDLWREKDIQQNISILSRN